VSRRLAVVLAVLPLVAAGCGGEGRASAGSPLTVFAASSLTDVFERLGGEFRDAHPDVQLDIGYGPSSGLARGIVEGAPADVFASANEAQMRVVTDEGLARDPVVFTSNVRQIAVPAGNPAGVTGLEDFTRGDLALALCAPEVPCGSAARDVFEAAGITPEPDTYEEDVRAALTKVELGEVDAALVYASDVASAGEEVEGIPFPEAEDAVNQYPICALADAPNPGAAEAFLDLVRSETGRRALRAAGFREP
jgi:molybdate transport system substrate-binding protein